MVFLSEFEANPEMHEMKFLPAKKFQDPRVEELSLSNANPKQKGKKLGNIKLRTSVRK